MSQLLAVENLTKAFGALRAVDGVSFSVEAGRVLGIAGPNGSGKSTLFNLITGLPFRSDRGRIVFDGKPIERMAPHRISGAGIARTFQTETDFESLSVLDNVLVAVPRSKHKSRSSRIESARNLLAFVGVEAGHDRLAGEISVFDRKRLMIASALATGPRLLLLDEPASGLAHPEVKETIALIRKIRSLGIGIMLIEHVISLLLSVSDRLLILNLGRILADGPPEAVVRDPKVIDAYLGSGASRAAAAS